MCMYRSCTPATLTRNREHAVNTVPKGRFELPRGYPHYALNVARLPFRHSGSFRGPWVQPGADRRTRTGDLLFTKQLLYQLS